MRNENRLLGLCTGHTNPLNANVSCCAKAVYTVTILKRRTIVTKNKWFDGVKIVGEAKRRKDLDPFYGKIPKVGKGIVVSPAVSIGANGSFTMLGGVDPVELRRAVLFWDRINRPTNNLIHIELSPDEKFLNECGILAEKNVRADFSGMIGHGYAESHLGAFSALEAEEPGLWTLSEGPNSFNLEADATFREGRGALVELHRAIPLPERDVPLEDLLNFKEKRRDEIKNLTLELDGLFSRIINSADSDFELNRAISEIDQKCSDVIIVGRESGIKFSLSDFSYGVSLEVNSTNLLTTGAAGFLFGSTIGLPLVGGAIGAAASTLKLNLSLGGKLQRSTKASELALSPYRVVSSLIDEPI